MAEQLDDVQPQPDVKKHRLRVIGASEVERWRRQAGWPPEQCSVPSDWRIGCIDCLLGESELTGSPCGGSSHG